MKERARELKKEADRIRESGDFGKAGNYYTAAAHEYAGTVTEHVFPEPDHTYAALSELLRATTCYRMTGDEFRVQNRCELGTLLAEDYIEYIDDQDYREGSFADLRRGAWPEYIGDLRTIAERDDADEAYDRAMKIYESAGSDIDIVCAEGEHMGLIRFFMSIRRGLGHEIPRDAPEQLTLEPETTFPEWLEYKRERLPSLLDQLEEQGEWVINKE